MTFAARLRQLREAKGLSIVELATRCDLPRQTIHKLENGERQPSLATAQMLAAAMGEKLRTWEACG